MAYFVIVSPVDTFDRGGIPPLAFSGLEANVKLKEFVAEVSKGGWVFSSNGGVIASIRVEDDKLVFVRDDGSESVLPTDGNNEITESGRPELITQINIRRPRMVRLQRPKTDGGGTYEVEKMGDYLVLINPGAQAQYQVLIKSYTKRKKEDAARQHAKAVAALLAQQLELIGNARVANIVSDARAALVIEFDNGHMLFVDSFGNGDGYNSEVRLAGSDTFDPEAGHSLENEGFDLIHHG